MKTGNMETEIIEVKTAELEGAALDWAVGASVNGTEFVGILPGLEWGSSISRNVKLGNWSPSTDWSQSGPLIEKYRLEIVSDGSRNEGWRCVKDWCYGEVNNTYPLGETHLIAACRAIVAAKLGDVVQVPAELIGATA